MAAAVAGAVMLGTAGTAGAAAHLTSPYADTWSMFGHDAMHSGVSPDTAIGASTAPTLATKWSKTLASTLDQASAMVAYNAVKNETLVYNVAYTGVATAYNASTGALVWTTKTAPNVYSSPAVYSNTVYFGDNEGHLYALNAATGAVQCTFTLPVFPPATTPGRIFSSPVVGAVDSTGPTVFFGDAGVSSGSNEPLNGGHLWAITGVGNTAGSCKLRWSFNSWLTHGSGHQVGVWIEPALAHESNGTWAVVFGSSNPDSAIYALNAVTGSKIWDFPTPQFGSDEDIGAGPTISPPGVNGFADGVVYNDGKDGMEFALDLLTGKPVWASPTTLGPPTSAAWAISEAALAGNTLVLGFGDQVIALNATTGAKIWDVTPDGTSTIFWGSPAVSGAPGDQVAFTGDINGHEYGFSLATGATLFTLSTGGRVQASAAVAKGALYLPSNGKLYALTPGGKAAAG